MLTPDFIAELRRRFTGDIRLDLAARALYSTDASIYKVEPLGVVLPRTQDDIQSVIELAARHHVPILPRGSGSSLAGQAIGKALILDFSRFLDKVVAINPGDRTAIVEPGVILATLNRAAAKHGLTFGPDPASAERATIGGVIGNNATGAHSILYGMTADHLVSAEVVLADGSLAEFGEITLERAYQIATDRQEIHGNFTFEQGQASPGLEASIYSAVLHIKSKYAESIKQAYPHTWRNSAGYRLNYLLPWSPSQPPRWIGESYPSLNIHHGNINLAPLLAGSEGTLAIVRRATVNLVPKNKFTVLGVLRFGSVAGACDAVPSLLERHPSAVELVPQMLLRLAKEVPAYASQLDWVQGDPEALLIVEFSGDDPIVLRQKAQALGEDVLIADTLEKQSRVWNVRKVGLGIFDSRPSSSRPLAIIEDCAIPVEVLGDFVREVEKIVAEFGSEAATYAHASAGCLHIRPILNLKTAEGVAALRGISQQVLALTLKLGGSMSSEHGDGLARAEWLQATYGKDITSAMRLLKLAADPHELLNPGKMLSAPPMDLNLRYGERYRASAWQPALGFERNGGLQIAIEQCNGAGVCRKIDGVMCPSFQATREEQNATRGRANLLRAMISNQADFQENMPSELQKATYEAMGLCLACKGCKAECPTGVDMAKLKYEYQNKYYQSHPRPVRDYVFAYINQLAPLGAPFGKMVNWIMSLSLTRKLTAKVLGVSETRNLPTFGKMARRDTKPRTEVVETILFLPDTFTHYFEPEIENAALEVFSVIGVKVIRIPAYGAGRTLISKGFIDPAKLHASRVLDEVKRLDPQGKYLVVGLEPSEVYTLRDEFIDLLPERCAETESLAGRAFLLDEFLVRHSPSLDKLRVGKLLEAKTPERTMSKVLLHGHCYQKAQPPHLDGFPVGQDATIALLRAIGCEVEVVPSGCCGMAGAFGYEAEHYGVSMQVGELVLLPKVREWASQQSDGRVVAPGTSCRAQIADGAGVKATHPIVVVAEMLTKSN